MTGIEGQVIGQRSEVVGATSSEGSSGSVRPPLVLHKPSLTAVFQMTDFDTGTEELA